MLKNFYYNFIKLNKLYAISLIEIMITIAIVAILMSISYNAITSLNVTSRRQEAHSELLKIKSIIEQLATAGYVDNTPVNNVIDAAISIRDSNFPSLKNYNVQIIVEEDKKSYTLTANATEPLRTQDSACANIKLQINSDGTENKTPVNCW